MLRVEMVREKVPDESAYPFSIPAIARIERLELHPKVTYFVGENGSGKSTLIEAIAVAAGFNAEGGSSNFKFSTRSSESALWRALRLVRRARRPQTGFFLRAESYFNVATKIEELDREPAAAPRIIDSFGGRSLHEQSHGESFFALLRHRFGPEGLYLLDEPEAALSPMRQMSALVRMHELVKQGSQFVIATHSPILLAYPNAKIYELSADGIEERAYEETATYAVTRDFILRRDLMLRELLGEEVSAREGTDRRSKR
ncbi:MAG: AAA family ATPase [Polyangiales bacterium]